MNNTATFEFIGSLGEFLNSSGNQSLKVSFKLSPSVKDLIESQGVPHTAIFKIEINGKGETLNYNLQDGDHISVYPFEAVDKSNFDSAFSSPTSFIGDIHLGKLVKTLRLLGFDTRFDQNWSDDEIIRRSNYNQRMILTRDLELLKNGKTKYGYWIRSTDPDRQIEELFQRFSLAQKIDPFTRCMKCNGTLSKVELNKVEEQVPPKVKEWHSVFFKCSNCGQVYWRGSHFKKLKERVSQLMKQEG